MCGRFAVTTDPDRLAEEIDAVDETGGSAPDSFAPNYNVAPTTEIAAVVARGDDPPRSIRMMRWGLLPSWVKADAQGRPMAKSQLINARAETAATTPAFRSAARHTRCLIPMDGYYEWMRTADDPHADAPRTPRKRPFYMFREDGGPLLVAGLWSAWKPDRSDAAGAKLTCTIITTDAVGDPARVHDRMPLILARADWDRWLDPDAPAPADLLAATPAIDGIAMREVSTLVNKVGNNGPELIAPVDRGNQPVGLF